MTWKLGICSTIAGVVLASAGVTVNNWQFYVVLTLMAVAGHSWKKK